MTLHTGQAGGWKIDFHTTMSRRRYWEPLFYSSWPVAGSENKWRAKDVTDLLHGQRLMRRRLGKNRRQQQTYRTTKYISNYNSTSCWHMVRDLTDLFWPVNWQNRFLNIQKKKKKIYITSSSFLCWWPTHDWVNKFWWNVWLQTDINIDRLWSYREPVLVKGKQSLGLLATLRQLIRYNLLVLLFFLSMYFHLHQYAEQRPHSRGRFIKISWKLRKKKQSGRRINKEIFFFIFFFKNEGKKELIISKLEKKKKKS